jgi:hypothetical protein
VAEGKAAPGFHAPYTADKDDVVRTACEVVEGRAGLPGLAERIPVADLGPYDGGGPSTARMSVAMAKTSSGPR